VLFSKSRPKADLMRLAMVLVSRLAFVCDLLHPRS
jgi:hypothetical protein